MNHSLILRYPGRALPLRRLPAAPRPGAIERYSFMVMLAAIAIGSLGILHALLAG